MAEAQQSADKEPSLFSLLSRDAMIVFAALTLWAASDAWFQVTGLFAAELLSAADGIFVGYIVAAIFHEWGHYLGARVSGAQTKRTLPKSLTNLFRFNFDFNNNSSRQFHSMSFGGWIGHWGILVLIFITLPLDTLGRRPWSARSLASLFSRHSLRPVFYVRPLAEQNPQRYWVNYRNGTSVKPAQWAP